uniref:FHA domain-containing protein n=1 Tax=Leptocylindrus danicus TaxID=163516 RepID=A0A7S2K9N1_9STRA|mmetsp:Transcript_19551/g.29082  ORF Transcript_19551/g.29082 Transcript_19551/m.29082 type:complete len:132 (+) Transcript_19551:1-396(+)
MKFKEPQEARAPMTKWRLYVFKKSNDNPEPIQIMHISKQSAYLFGRDTRVADIVVEHPSLSKQHCVLQYRALPDKKQGGQIRCKPYLMDLGSTNGTFINGQRLEEARYYELRKKDVITLGMSSREYVLLTG